MPRTLIARILAGSLLVAGCSAAPETLKVPLEPAGTLEARVTLGDYRTQELMWNLSTVSCRVKQDGAEARQDLGRNQLELGAFAFKLSVGTASVRTEALSASGSVIGRSDAVVGIRTGQVTLLRQVLEIGGLNDSFLRPLMPLPFQPLN